MKAKTRNTACTGAKHPPPARAIAAVFPRHAGDALLPQKLRYTVCPRDHPLPAGMLEAWDDSSSYVLPKLQAISITACTMPCHSDQAYIDWVRQS